MQAHEAVAPVQLYTDQLKKIRQQVHNARYVIIDIFLVYCYIFLIAGLEMGFRNQNSSKDYKVILRVNIEV